jgi:subtilisin family serine protease
MRLRARTGVMLAGVLALGGIAAACQPPPPPPPPPSTCDPAAVAPSAQSPVTYAAVVAPHDGAPHEVTAFTATSNAGKDAKVSQLEQSSTVLALEPNHPVHVADAPINTANYAEFPQQWGLKSAPGADFAPAWNAGFTGQGITVAVVDTGVDLDHTGLAGHVTAGPDFIVDPTGTTPVTGDAYGHGTHVAGIIAANDSPGGGLGGAPGATILAVRVLNQDGVGSSFTVAQGIEWAAQHGASVINLSLGEASCDTVIGQAMVDAHTDRVVVAAAAGNDDSSELFAPAAYSAEDIAVAATNQSGQKAAFSNFGGYVAIAAPGENVVSTCAYTPSCIGSPTPSNSAYNDLSGTSMATPFVSAAAALVKEECPSFLPDQIKAELVNRAGAAVPGYPFRSLDAGLAVAADCS